MSLARAHSLVTTAILWTYFIGAFVAGYWLVFLVAGLVLARRGLAWSLGSYSRGFFALLGLLVPRSRLQVPHRSALRRTRGSVVVCNHISFLDPLLLLSLLPRVITIVRPDFFAVPIFGWLLRGAGFLGPDLYDEGQAWVERVARHLREGGNLLIFPEGTRSRDGSLAPFKKGAFYLARTLQAPLLVLRVAGTNHLFAPGRLSFDAALAEPVEVRLLSTIAAAEANTETSQELAQQVRRLYEAG
ncbi:MAG: 1-acyl-sn-glycerol-3-phosphate acyltransferase [Deltaproteobacteria bacterium]|nr:1-acyl-sn-glycerol-3-phosphate acyltransferase [Deltaproteobacteria bacterium]